ncbi:MAG: hypothetical protein JWR09_5658 [Mucilaginibacter sp.]|nr:hypothetical protein [Mucilaginibacter sp.]
MKTKSFIIAGIICYSIFGTVGFVKSEKANSKKWLMYDVDLCSKTNPNGTITTTAKCYIPDPSGPCLIISPCATITD